MLCVGHRDHRAGRRASGGWRSCGTSRPPSAGRAPEATCLAAVGELARQPGRRPVRADLPASTTAGTARLAGAAGIERGGAGGARDRPRAVRGPAAPGRCGGVAAQRRAREVVRDLVGDAADRSWRPPPGTAVPADAVVAPPPSPGRPEPAGFLVVGLNPHRALDDAYRGFVDLVADQIASGLVNARSLRGRAAPGRGAGRARPGQDRLLLQRQPRVPHAADADHGPGRRAARPPAVAADPRAREELEVIHRNALRLRQAGQHPAGLLPAAGGPRSRPASSRSTWPRSPPSWPASSARPWSGPGCAFDVDCPPLRPSRSTSTGTCGRRSSSTCCPTP